jgi:GNAT superfamily N-acetyltransferase
MGHPASFGGMGYANKTESSPERCESSNTQMEKPTTSAVQIREFQTGDAEAFRRLNEEWVTRYFRIEPKDAKVFADPQHTILDEGGRIVMALQGERYVGCCALLRMDDDSFEVAKMAVTPESQGQGVGRLILREVIETARRAGARRLYLETNHILTPAIRLYESLGFRHLPPERVTPSPYERADVFMELLLG